MLFVDLSRAYDCVQHPVLWRMLRARGFGQQFTSALRAAIQHCDARISLHGTLGPPIHFDAGVKQGCPASPLLFVLYMDYLVRSFEEDPEYGGVPLPGGQARVAVSAFADDVVIYIGSPQDLCLATNKLENFANSFGIRANGAKTRLMTFGDWEGKATGGFSLIPPTAPVTYLGVRLGDTVALQDFRQQMANKLKRRLLLCTKHTGNIYARATFTNAYLVGPLRHALLVTPWPASDLRSLQPFIAKATVATCTTLMPRNALYAPRDAGGLDLVHLHALKLHLRLSIFRNMHSYGRLSSWIGFYLHKLIPGFVVYNGPPCSIATPPILREVASAVRRTYLDPLSQVFLGLTHKCDRRSVQSLSFSTTAVMQRLRPLRTYNIFHTLRHTVVHPKTVDVVWKTVHGSLPTMHYLATRHIIPPHQALCGKCIQRNETVEHLAFFCPFFSALRSTIQNALGAAFPTSADDIGWPMTKLRPPVAAVWFTFLRVLWTVRCAPTSAYATPSNVSPLFGRWIGQLAGLASLDRGTYDDWRALLQRMDLLDILTVITRPP